MTASGEFLHRIARHRFALACLACALPALMSTYPPMVDIPQHAAIIASIKAMLFGGHWPYADLFAIKPFTPYWLGYGAVMLLSFPFGIAWATTLVVAAATSLTAWSAARLCNRLGTDPAWNWVFLLMPFGFAWQWGFLNFIVAIPIGFLFLRALLELRGRSDWRACLRIASWLHLLFFAHVLAAFFFCIVAVLLLAAPWTGWQAWLRRSLPVSTILPVAAIWYACSLFGTHAGDVPPAWKIDADRPFEWLLGFVPAPGHAASLALAALVAILPFASGAKPKRFLPAWLPFVFHLAWMLFAPWEANGTADVYERFDILGLPLYLACFTRGDGGSRPARACIVSSSLIAACIATLAWHCIRSIGFERTTADYRAVIAQAEPGKRIGMIVPKPDKRDSSLYLTRNLASWYQAEHAGLAEYGFAGVWSEPLQWRDPADATIDEYAAWHPEQLDWDRNRLQRLDYLLVAYPRDASAWLRNLSHGHSEPIARSGDFQLFRIAHDATQPP